MVENVSQLGDSKQFIYLLRFILRNVAQGLSLI